MGEASSSEEEDEYNTQEQSKKQVVEEHIGAVNRTQFETMEYQVIIDPGAAGRVLPVGWCPKQPFPSPSKLVKHTV